MDTSEFMKNIKWKTLYWSNELTMMRENNGSWRFQKKIKEGRTLKYMKNQRWGLMINYKLMAIKLGESLKYGSSVNEINRIGQAIFPFNAISHPNDSITSVRAQLVYDWIMTLGEQSNPESEKIGLLNIFIKELAPEFAVSKLSEGFDIVKKTKEEKVNKVDSKSIFVLMPFEEQFQTIYYNAIKPVVEALGYSVSKADEDLRTGTIIEQIQDSIRDSLLIIADVSGKNPNVFYELGFAHGLNREVLIITQNEDDIPFDISHIRHFKYSYNPNFEILKKQFYPIFKKNLEAISNDK